MQSQNYARYQCRLRDINNKLFALPDVPKIAEVTIGLSAFRYTAAPKQCKTNGTVYTKKKTKIKPKSVRRTQLQQH